MEIWRETELWKKKQNELKDLVQEQNIGLRMQLLCYKAIVRWGDVEEGRWIYPTLSPQKVTAKYKLS